MSSDAFSAWVRAIFRIRSLAEGRSAGFVVMVGSPRRLSVDNIFNSLRRGLDVSQYCVVPVAQNAWSFPKGFRMLKDKNSAAATMVAGDRRPADKMKRKAYEKELRKLQVELCRLQDWAKEMGERIIILFEGRDAAGKGGTIKAITERVSPRVFRVVALPAPSDRERAPMYMQRYIEHLPAAG